MRTNYNSEVIRSNVHAKDFENDKNGISWCVPYYTPNFPRKEILNKHIVSKAPKDLNIF